MHRILIFLLLSTSTSLLSQNNLPFFYNNGEGGLDGRFGITVGATNYITDTQYLLSKSSTGFTVGAMGTVEFSKRFELFIEINYNKHFVKFIGRESELASPEDIKFNLQNISMPILLNFSYLVKDDYKLGVNVGPSFSIYHEYEIVDDTKKLYSLDPLYTTPSNLRFTAKNEQASFNTFVAFGLSAQYKKIMTNLRYYYGITDPYRHSPVYSPFMDINGKDSYLSLTFTYFL